MINKIEKALVTLRKKEKKGEKKKFTDDGGDVKTDITQGYKGP